ncbi:PorT family protein [Carboxylicivirga sp. A043]|uniref:PorT family protein n=1 Tax=Carboxylicivirga litoralis TaxID=2816963 RepID=UPI0021CB2B5D|nr:PorT family protein [Carboxylicivirga sp. A043]MCU4157183.1 PorT family protein [Carboxylicivirga sp. A043]
MRRVMMIGLVIAMLGFVSNVNAKDDGPDGRGIRAGYQKSFLSVDGEKLTDKSDGFYVGFFKNNKIAPMLRWQSGFEYYQVKGANDFAELKVHYLSIPLSLRLKLGPVYALGGLNGAVRIADSYDSNIAGTLPEIPGIEIPSLTGEPDLSRWDAGAHLGVGFKFLMLGVEARYNWGFVDVIDGMNTEYLQVGACLFF